MNGMKGLKSATPSSLLGKFCAFSKVVLQIVLVIDLDIMA